MTDYGDLETPEFFNTTQPTAVKVHKCCECSDPIEPGDSYERTVGVWDNEFATFKTCSSCQEVSSWAKTSGYYIGFGALYETLDEHYIGELPPLVALAIQSRD